LVLAPQDAEIVFVHGRHLMQSGYLAAGLARVERALLIDPAHPNALWRRALASIDAGDLAAAELAFERAGDLDFSWFDRGPLELARARGEWLQARQLSQALNANITPSPHYGSACLRDLQSELDAIDAAMYGGSPEERAKAKALIEGCLASRPPVIPERMQIALLRMGEPELALAAIAAGPSSGQAGILVTLWGPPGEAARRSPQFAAFARDYGYAALWDVHGAPDGCQRLAPAEYRCD
jgi:tetratricopeptide (TPR) repeat protein